MISFRHRNNIKRIQLTQRISEERLTRMLNQIFNIKGPIVGFKSESGKYYDKEYFCRQKAKFYGDIVDVMDATDQMEISFTSDNLSTSFIQPQPNRNNSQQQQQHSTTSETSNLGCVRDLHTIQKIIISDPTCLSIIFVLEEMPYKTQLLPKLDSLANRHQDVRMFYHILPTCDKNKFRISLPLYLVYIGKKNICEMAMRHNFESTVQTAILRWNQQQPKEDGISINPIDDDCPSFITNTVIQRISKETAEEYLQQMANEYMITEQQQRRLSNMLESRFVEFCRTFCPNLIDTDYESFRTEVLAQLQKFRNDDELPDEFLDRPISREEQRKSNLKKFVSKVQIVKVQSCFEILESLSDIIFYDELNSIKTLLIEENEDVINYFAGFLSHEYDKLTLANNLVIIAANLRSATRPISRCVPRNSKMNREGPYENNPSKMTSPLQVKGHIANPAISERKQIEEDTYKLLDINTFQEEFIKLEDIPEFGICRAPITRPLQSNQEKLSSQYHSPQNLILGAPPLINSSFSPLKVMQQQNLQHIYRNVEKLILKKTQLFNPEEYGLFVHLLKTCDPSIYQLVQQIELSPQNSDLVSSIKKAMDKRLDYIFKSEFTSKQIEYLLGEKQIEGAIIYCFFENFRYEADLDMFLSELRKQIGKQAHILLNKKSSLSSLKLTNINVPKDEKAATNSSNGYNTQQDSIDSKDSARRIEQGKFEELDHFYEAQYLWKEFDEMLQCVELSEKTITKLKKMMDNLSPSLLLIVREYLQSKQKNTPFNKNNIKTHTRKQDKHITCPRLRKYTCFKYLLIALQNQGKLDDAKSRWLRVNFIDENFALVSAFETYLIDKNEKELLENIDLIMKVQSLKIKKTELDTFVNRIAFFMSQIYEHPNMLTFTIEKYSRVFKGICELYHMNADSSQLFKNLDLLNSYSFERRVAEELSRNFLNEKQRKLIIDHFNLQIIPLVQGVISTFENGRDFRCFLMRYLQEVKITSPVKKLSAIDEIKSQEKLEVDATHRAKAQILSVMERNKFSKHLIQKVDQLNQADSKLCSLWQLYEVTHCNEELIENLEILLMTLQENEHTKHFAEKINSQDISLPAKNRLTVKQPELMKIIRKFSFGVVEDDQFQSLQEYEREELPIVIREILRSFGLSTIQIEKAIRINSDSVERAVKKYIENQHEQTLMELLQRVVDQEDENVANEKPPKIEPGPTVKQKTQSTD